VQESSGLGRRAHGRDGHATIHTWTCVGSEARIAQSEKLDPRGFIAALWTSLAR
jgi:hypothetical protein